jgi:dihydropyrimidinase
MAAYDKILTGGKLVLPGRGVTEGSIGIRDGKIAAIWSGHQARSDAATVVDCAGHWVMPGLIDPHVHFGFGTPERDFATESRSAAVGGVTTILSFFRAEDIAAALPAEIGRAESQSHIDFGFHFGITSHAQVAQLAELTELFGVRSYKLYLMYKGEAGRARGFTEIDDALLYALLEQASQIPGAVVGVHCENVEVIPLLRSRLKAAGRDDLAAWDEQSPDFLEAENIHRVCYFARQLGCRVNIVHVSSAEGLSEALRHRAAGADVTIETCPHYLALDSSDSVGHIGKVNPPLRSGSDSEALWTALADGSLDTIGSDHVPRKLETKQDSIWSASAGFPGVATMLPLLIELGVHGRAIPIERIAELTSLNVARLYGLKDKGDIRVGMDADLIVVDPQSARTVDASALESFSDYTPYRNRSLRGWPVKTFVRGQLVMEDGKITAAAPRGQYLRR